MHSPPPSEPAHPNALLAALGLTAGLLAAALALGALGGVTHVPDEHAYLVQARIFAHLERVGPAAEGLRSLVSYVRLSPEQYGVFPIGWPLVLTLGVWAGAPALANPLLSALLPWLAWHAFRPWLDRRPATVAAAIFAFSPGLLALGGSMMSHTLTLVCALGFLALARRPHPAARLGASLLVGLLVLTRPFDAALLGGPSLLWALRHHGRRGWPLLVGPLLALGITLADNRARTGDALLFPVDHYHQVPNQDAPSFPPGCNRLGFGEDRGCFHRVGYSPADAAANMALQARFFDRLFLGFRGSGVLVLLGAALLLRRAPVLLWPLVGVPLGYALYWYEGIVYGARFWALAYLGAAPAAALAMEAIAARLRAAWLPIPLVLAALTAYPALYLEFADRYFCVDDERIAGILAAALPRGPVLLTELGGWTGSWPLTVPTEMDCSTMASAPLLASNDPFGEQGPVYVRAGVDAMETLRMVARTVAGPAHLVQSNLVTGAWRILPVDAPAAPRTAGSPDPRTPALRVPDAAGPTSAE